MSEDIKVVANLPAVAEEGELFRELAGGNLYRWEDGGWKFVPESPAAQRRVEDSVVGEIDAEPVPMPADAPNGAAITPPAAGGPDSGASERAADTLIDSITGAPAPQEPGTDANGSPVEDAPSEPPPPPPAPEQKVSEDAPEPKKELSEDDIEKLAKARRKKAKDDLEKEEGK